MEASQQPPNTPTDEQKAREVAVAGGQAAAAAQQEGQNPQPAAEKAMRAEADRQDLKLSDEEIEKIAAAMTAQAAVFADALAERFDQRGAFQDKPEPVQPPAAAPAPPGEAQQATPVEEPSGPPRKPSFAERFLGDR